MLHFIIKLFREEEEIFFSLDNKDLILSEFFSDKFLSFSFFLFFKLVLVKEIHD